MDKNWYGTRPALMRKGDIVVTGTRMGPYGGVAVGKDSIAQMSLPDSVPGYYHDYRVPTYAELPDSEWLKLGWIVTDAR